MAKKIFLKIWTSLLSSLALANVDAIADIHTGTFQNDGSDTIIAAKESNATELFLHHAKDAYADQMLFAGHRSHSSHSSHSSHRSHYSSRSYDYTDPSPSTPSTTSPNKQSPSSGNQSGNNKSNNGVKAPAQTKKYNIADVKMVQIALNTLGFDAGKVDGLEGKPVREALSKYQVSYGLQAKGEINSQTCLSLARAIKEKFPEDENAKKMYHNLMRLYLKLASE